MTMETLETVMVYLPELTKGEERCLEIIRAYIQLEGLPPTLKEIAAALGHRSTNQVRRYLGHLERKNRLERKSGCSRGIVLLATD